jgi:hypothetical protein
MPKLRVQSPAGDDRAALAWAWATRSVTGQVLRGRLERGDGPAPTPEELVTVREEWEAAGRPSVEPHVHRQVVVLLDGTPVRVASYLGPDPHGRDAVPDFGLYLDPRWDPPWPHRHVEWPDFGIADIGALRPALEDLLARARGGEDVEFGCVGGHGRTGTALACLAVMTGVARDAAVEWVRETYCSEAVETAEQRALIEAF